MRTYRRASAREGRRSRRVLIALALLALAAIACAAVATFAGGRLFGTRGAADASARREPADRAVEPTGGAAKPAAASTATPTTPSRPATLTVAAVGDMIFDRRVGSLVRTAGGEAPLACVAALLESADITVGNLESPLSSAGTRIADKDVTFRGQPAAIAGLELAGFDLLSLANNHALDYGPEALADTIELLDGAGIGHAGAGENRAAARKPAVVERDGASVAFLSFSHVLPPGFIATSDRAGIAQGRANMSAVTRAIREAADEHDYVIVSFHWGVEYADDANGDQVRDAHAAVDAGADMVLSHHPHVIQGVERFDDALIAYSTGDFVFDHFSRKTGEAFILNAELGPGGVGEVSFTPVYLDSNGRPEVVAGRAAREILGRLRRISAPLGGRVRITGDTAVLE